MKLQALAFFVAALAMAPCPSPAAAPAVAAMALPDCSGKPMIKPSNVVLTCADAGVIADKVTWTGWGSTFAAGIGIASVNDCQPNCAAGHVHKYHVVLLAGGEQRCPNGQAAYNHITYAWIGRSPYPQGAPGTVVPVVHYVCGPQP